MWRVSDAHKASHFLQLARWAFGNRDTISSTFLSLDNPVSLDRNALQNVLNANRYMVTHKANGTRYVLCLDMYDNHPAACFVNRAGEVFSTPVRACATRFARRCVFDGEMCQPQQQQQHNHHQHGTAPSKSFFLIFNALVVNGRCLRDDPYVRRLEILTSCFAACTLADKQFAQQSLIDLPKNIIASALPNIVFAVKPVVPLHQIHSLPSPVFETDGLVFTPMHDPVRTGRNPRLFKWKSHNTIDVAFSLVSQHREVNGKDAQKGIAAVEEEGEKERARRPHLKLWWDDEDTGKPDPVDAQQFRFDLASIGLIIDGFEIAKSMCPTIEWSGIMECWLSHEIVDEAAPEPTTAFTSRMRARSSKLFGGSSSSSSRSSSNTTTTTVRRYIHVLHYLHTRHDKRTANTRLTVERTLQTIEDKITIQEILDRFAQEGEDAQPPDYFV